MFPVTLKTNRSNQLYIYRNYGFIFILYKYNAYYVFVSDIIILSICLVIMCHTNITAIKWNRNIFQRKASA